MKTRITELFGIKYPILLSGMSWISVPSLVAAVSNAGGLGLLATGTLSPDETREAIREIKSLTKKPFGANATLLFPGAAENVAVLLEEKVPVINFSLGKGDWIVKAAHEYGGKVIATVVYHRHAMRAEDYGCDGLIVTGHEAAAHGGDVTSLVLIPSIVDSVKIPVIAAGGFCDGRGLITALTLGAEGIAMGTRFSNTQESPLHNNFKQLSINKEVYDTIYSNRIDGLPCRVLKNEAAEKTAKKLTPGFFKAIFNSRELAEMMNLSHFKLIIGVLLSGWSNIKQLSYMANASKSIRYAIDDGDTQKGILPLGQDTGMIDDIPTVSELIKRIIADARKAKKKISEISF